MIIINWNIRQFLTMIEILANNISNHNYPEIISKNALVRLTFQRHSNNRTAYIIHY